ncbi:winged helix-turn-helix transcriptional regulator [Phragmitibacter flavus]|uniref:Winged helix-turn-helix transcriptional regulator n=1 Tax=Phragmitibacter flavus TaxID=2576071 RepID=A0A5R8KBH0_9BACT|nr:metalloregulator ArsR/SmtB family transcription factor [Phragmitibacter flavus]TLD69652.1 winged helix-turn-helix transcriptional regulator [Phragmitibacter flavus]
MKNLVNCCHAFADETRWRMVQLLLDEALCVCEVADILKMPQSSASSHLQVIRKAGVLESERRGKWIYYRVQPGQRKMVLAMGKFFGVSVETDAVLRGDAKRAVKRLAERESACCPLPKMLASK